MKSLLIGHSILHIYFKYQFCKNKKYAQNVSTLACAKPKNTQSSNCTSNCAINLRKLNM